MGADPRVADVASSREQPGFKIGRALLETARANARIFTSTFHEDEKFAVGENQWPIPSSYRAWYRQRWKNESVRNYTFSTIRKKLSVVLAAPTSIQAEARDEMTTLEERQQIAAAVRHEGERMGWEKYRRGAFHKGAMVGKGMVHFYPERNLYQTPQGEVVSLYQIKAELMDMTRFYPQPGVQFLHEMDYTIYEPDLSMSRIRRAFPDNWQMVKPEGRSMGKLGDVQYSRTQDEIIYGNATGEISISKDGDIVDRFSPVAFIHIKDQSIIKDTTDVLSREAQPGLQCTDCGDMIGKSETITNFEDRSRPMCPTCYGTNLQQTMMPPEYDQQVNLQLMYPHGRLICLTKDALLFDGPCDVILDGTFPYAEYNHYPLPIQGRYWGYGDVALLKKVQQALNTNASQAINNMRLCGNPPMEVPSEVPAWRHVGNAPGDQVPCPAAFMNLAHYISPANSYNVMLHQVLDEALKRDIQEVSGVSDVSLGIAPNAPTSGREVIARQNAASSTMQDHNDLFNEFESQAYSIIWQMMNQFYTEPRAYVQAGVNGELTSIVLEVSTLPRNVRVKVKSSLDQVEKDQNFGQNMMQAVTAGQLGFYPDLMLPLMGASPEVSREIQQRETVRLQQQAAAAQAAAMSGAAPGNATGTPPTPDQGGAGAPPPLLPQGAPA